MPAELYDTMYVEAGIPIDEAVFAHGLTMSRTGRVRAKKQHLRMETYIQTQTDYENEEKLDRQRKANSLLVDSRTLPRTPENRGEIVAPYQMKTIPSTVEKRDKDIRKDRGKKIPKSSAGPTMNGIKIHHSIGRPKSTLARSSSIEEKNESNQFDRTEQKFETMTLSRIPRKRNKEERPHFVSPTRRKSPGLKLTEILSPRKEKSSNSKLFLDVNGNDASRKGNTLGRYKRNDHSPASEDELPRQRSNTFSTNNGQSKPFRQAKKSEADEYGKTDFTLEDMLKNKAATQAFRAFLKSEFSEENLDFWLDCDFYRSLKGSKQMKMAFRIFAHYLARSAPREVNIDSEIRTRTEENLKNPDNDTFVEAQNCIYSLMKSDSFRRFITSERYLKLQFTDPKPSFKKTTTKTTR